MNPTLRKICFCICSLAFANSLAFASQPAYWIWAGIAAQDAPQNAQLYIYQGVIAGNGSGFSFQKKGLYPYPVQAEGILLTYRVNGTALDTERLLALFLFHAELWERHKVKVRGLQIDRDVATAKLRDYSYELSKLRARLDPSYRLSITGLADWAVHARPGALNALHKAVDEVVYQLYQVDAYVPAAETYVKALELQGRPYKLGLLKNLAPTFPLETSRYRKGLVYFLQRKK